MEAFINGMSCISHYNTIDENFFFEGTPSKPNERFLTVTPPEYKNYIPVNTIRRTSQILKMGISAGLICLQRAGIEKPGAIIVGTGMGCFEDTDKFLRALTENDEKMLTPTPFIQSTHNTVAGQIALLTKSQGYNFTYVHQNVSFESALLDALMLLEEKEADNILIGGLDELNDALRELFDRAGHIKKEEHLHEKIWESINGGYVAGQGAAFFTLSNSKTAASIAKITGVKTLQVVADDEVLKIKANNYLTELGMKLSDIDLVLSGCCGDHELDKTLNTFISGVERPVAYFKNICGEFFTSSSFALWLGANILKKQMVPDCIIPEKKPDRLKNILIVNHYRDEIYSFMSVSQC